MPLPKKILNYLKKNGYKYKLIQHRTTYTAWDTAQTGKVKPQEVGKALVLKLDKDWIVALLSANRNLDKKKLLKIVNAKFKKEGLKLNKKIEFAKEAWMRKNIDGKLGAMAPFAGFLKKYVFMDASFVKNKKVYLGTGDYQYSVWINMKDFMKKEQPIVGVFSIKK